MSRAPSPCTAAAGGRYRIVSHKLPRSADGQREQMVRRLAAADPSLDVLGLAVPWVPAFSAGRLGGSVAPPDGAGGRRDRTARPPGRGGAAWCSGVRDEGGGQRRQRVLRGRGDRAGRCVRCRGAVCRAPPRPGRRRAVDRMRRAAGEAAEAAHRPPLPAA